MRILFVGNSLTYASDMPEILKRMFESQGFEPITIEAVAEPNYGMQDTGYSAETRGSRRGVTIPL